MSRKHTYDNCRRFENIDGNIVEKVEKTHHKFSRWSKCFGIFRVKTNFGQAAIGITLLTTASRTILEISELLSHKPVCILVWNFLISYVARWRLRHVSACVKLPQCVPQCYVTTHEFECSRPHAYLSSVIFLRHFSVSTLSQSLTHTRQAVLIIVIGVASMRQEEAVASSWIFRLTMVLPVVF